MTKFRNPKQEAQDFIDANLTEPAGLTAYVLESSPPAQTEGPLFADLPLEISGDPKTAITPTSAGAHQYEDYEALKEFASERWLGFLKPLPPLPSNWISQLEDAHRLAFGVISEARRLNNGKFGLRWVKDGFGTPFYGDNIQVRVTEGVITLQDSTVQVAPVTTLQAAGDFLGLTPTGTQREGDSPELGDLNRELNFSKECNDFLGSWFGLATSAMEEINLRGSDPAPIQIWPGHFDAATEVNNGNNRCTFGASPGDHNHSEPYLYISPHVEIDKSNPFWNAESYSGAFLSLNDFPQENQRQAILDFFQMGLDLIK